MESRLLVGVFSKCFEGRSSVVRGCRSDLRGAIKAYREQPLYSFGKIEDLSSCSGHLSSKKIKQLLKGVFLHSAHSINFLIQSRTNLNWMTEYSKNSRKMRADTVSNTGGRSAEIQTHPYSGEGESHERYSHNESMGSQPDAVEEGIELPIQYIMPLVNSIKSQNEHLRQQRTLMQAEMSQLHRQAQQLLQQNQQLRRHYSLRTQDIRRLVETISINTHEEATDLEHQAFLLRQSNHALVKKIEELIRESSQSHAALVNAANQLQPLREHCRQAEQAQRQLQVKNRQLFLKCQQLRREVENQDSQADNEANNAVLREVVALTCENRRSVLKAKELLDETQEERPFLQQNLTRAVEQNRQMKVEEQALRETFRNTDRRLQQLRISYEQSVGRFTESFRTYQRAKNTINQTQQQIVSTKTQINDKKLTIKRKQETTKAQLSAQRSALKEKILQKKKQIRQKQEQRLQAEQQIAKECKQEVQRLSEQLSQQCARANEQIARNITPQLAKVTAAIDQEKEEYAELVQEVEELREVVRKLENPRKEIIRLEYQLKKLANRKN